MSVQSVQWGQSTEDYLKAIFSLERESAPVSTKRLAGQLGVSAAAVSKAAQMLARKKLVKYEAYRGVSLRPQGRRIALELTRHHRLIETFLHDILGYSWDEVDDEAERLEHHVSKKFVARIDKLLNHPTTDPHGAPIPSQDGALAAVEGVPLKECRVGDTVRIQRVRDSDPEMLRFLDARGMRPGAVAIIHERQPFEGPMTLEVNHERVVVGGLILTHVLATPTKQGKSK